MLSMNQFTAFEQTVSGPLQLVDYYDGSTLKLGSPGRSDLHDLDSLHQICAELSADADVPTIPQAFREL
jgi:hypothetical protein